ncbi:MAG: sulfite exporter TauE/SafE family protein [Desulforhabdus sp.]|jgi:sulfite exporter TauE/SafE|nr:sulfite exporter TauE/SafE family protein [Desulforhabdus sp.]
MLELLAPFSIGFIGSLHCLGMCGPLVLAYSLHIRSDQKQPTDTLSTAWKSGFWHHSGFHLGRIITYGLLGALAAGLFHLADLSRFFADLRGSMTLLGGALMVLIGLVLLHVLPLPSFLTSVPTGTDTLWGRSVPRLLRSHSVGSKLLLGLATGFLPCGLSWAMIIKAATTQNPAAGFLTMAAFGLGTVPALFLTGLSASVLSLKTRILGEKVAAVSVIAMGLILVFKGAKVFV